MASLSPDIQRREDWRYKQREEKVKERNEMKYNGKINLNKLLIPSHTSIAHTFRNPDGPPFSLMSCSEVDSQTWQKAPSSGRGRMLWILNGESGYFFVHASSEEMQ
jgi:hypothetical protein